MLQMQSGRRVSLYSRFQTYQTLDIFFFSDKYKWLKLEQFITQITARGSSYNKKLQRWEEGILPLRLFLIMNYVLQLGILTLRT